MTTKMIFRQALDKDVPAVTEILGPWINEDQAALPDGRAEGARKVLARGHRVRRLRSRIGTNICR